MRIVNVFGPNLNLLGKRKAEHYGKMTFEQLNDVVESKAIELGFSYNYFWSNSEAELLDFFQSFITSEDEDVVFLVNLGAFTHYSYALGDCLEVLKDYNDIVEVHLSNIHERESFRSFSVVKQCAKKQFYGKKEVSYFEALEFISKELCQNG